jgi:hypothetical protein
MYKFHFKRIEDINLRESFLVATNRLKKYSKIYFSNMVLLEKDGVVFLLHGVFPFMKYSPAFSRRGLGGG